MNNITTSNNKNTIEYKKNYGIAKYLDQDVMNNYGLPNHYCKPNVFPDFMALSRETGKYHKTPLTALCFYEFDRVFDNKDGLYNAIYYNDIRRQEFFKKKYKDIRFVIAPDYSIYDDIWPHENDSRILKIRVIMLWFLFETNAIVIPNAIYASADKLDEYYSGFEECSVMCFSTKGYVRNASDRKRVKETVKYVVDNLNIKTILVYSVCGKDETSKKLFKYAIQKGVDVRVVDNTMRQQNRMHLIKKEALWVADKEAV